jgi:TPR repeat protein
MKLIFTLLCLLIICGCQSTPSNNKRNNTTVSTAEKEAITRSAINGNAEAQFELGVWYSHGIGVDKDYEVAVKWYTKAAEQGLFIAQFHLGLCYHYGRGIEKDPEKAKEWLKKAENQFKEKESQN